MKSRLYILLLLAVLGMTEVDGQDLKPSDTVAEELVRSAPLPLPCCNGLATSRSNVVLCFRIILRKSILLKSAL